MEEGIIMRDLENVKDKITEKLLEMIDDIRDMESENGGYTNREWATQKSSYYKAIDIVEETIDAYIKEVESKY